jgi:hypothetical protein
MSEKDQGRKEGWGERAGQKSSTAVVGNEHGPESLDECDSPVLGGRQRTRTRESGNGSNRDKEKRRRSTSAREAPRLLHLSDFCKDAGGQTGKGFSEEQPQREGGGKEKPSVDLQEADSHPFAAFGFARKEPVQADGKRGLDAKQDEDEGPKQDFADREQRPNDQRRSYGGGVERRERSRQQKGDGDVRLDPCEEGMHGEEPPEYLATHMEADIDLEEREEARVDDLSVVSVDKLASSNAHSQPDSGNEETLEEELALSSWRMPASETAHNQKAVHQERGQDEGQRRAISTAGLDGGEGATGLMRAPDRVSGMRRSNTVGAPDRVTGEGYLRSSITGSGVLGRGASSSRGEYEARDAKGGTGGKGGGDKTRQQRKRCLPMPAIRCG